MNIVVSGATKGIGRAIVYLFAENGYDVAFCARTRKEVDAMAADLRKRYAGVEVLAMAADLSERKEVTRFADMVNKAWNTLDVLVNNAGLFQPDTIHEAEEGTLEKMMDINLFSAYYLTRAFVSDMKAHGKGHVVNICSTAGKVAYVNGGSYCIAKHAMMGMHKVLREEMKAHGVRVTAILPGPTYTASWEGVDLPESRFMPPEEVAEVVWQTCTLSPRTNVEEILLRPQLGDI